jgi:hypothetical protein
MHFRAPWKEGSTYTLKRQLTIQAHTELTAGMEPPLYNKLQFLLYEPIEKFDNDRLHLQVQ